MTKRTTHHHSKPNPLSQSSHYLILILPKGCPTAKRHIRWYPNPPIFSPKYQFGRKMSVPILSGHQALMPKPSGLVSTFTLTRSSNQFQLYLASGSVTLPLFIRDLRQPLAKRQWSLKPLNSLTYASRDLVEAVVPFAWSYLPQWRHYCCENPRTVQRDPSK